MKRRLTTLLTVATLALVALPLFLVAQQYATYLAKKITFGPGTGPSITWGSSAPVAPCQPGSVYLQRVSAAEGTPWVCKSDPSSITSGLWTSVNGSAAGEYAITDFGAKCDGSTDDYVAIQAAIDAAFAFGKAGRVVIPAGNCHYGQPLVFGAITDPWETDPADPLFHTNVGLAFNAPRSATITYTASSSTITWSGSTVTSADVGNFVFYGPVDADYLDIGITRVTRPTYGCTITAILTSTSATCVASSLQATNGVPLAATTGAHASYITDDHNVTIDDTVFNADSATFDADHVGKTLFFALPVIRAPLDFANADRPGSHVALEAPPSPCSGGGGIATWSWQCYNTALTKTQYFTAHITSVTDPTHAKMQIDGLSPGSNWVGNFPDYPVHAGVSAECGGSDANCASFPAHEWAHLIPPATSLLISNPHLSHTIDTTISSDFNQATNTHTYLGVLYPYALPSDTSQRYMSMRGASSAASLLTFTGDCSGGQWDAACAALIVSRTKYFSFADFSVINGSGSSIDDTSQWGIAFGGLPGVGTQALGFKVDRVGVGGFGVCVQLGDNLGGEVSDADFELLSVSNCGIGVRIGPGSFNTLDFKFHDLQGGLNKIGLLNTSGNVFIDKGSFSFNDIDFVDAGFGPFSVSNMRSEGPGIFLAGGSAGTRIVNNNLAEPSATRQITGDVVATPSDTHTVVNVVVDNDDVGIPANSFYPITFGSGDITGADLRKTVILPGVGAAGADVIAQIWDVTTLTDGVVFSPVVGAITTDATVTATVYDTNLADLTFPSGELLTGDIGASLALPDSTALGTKAVRCAITEITTATTGKCGFFLGGQGAGPLIAGTSTDPKLFVHIVAFWTSNTGAGATFENNLFPTGRVFLDLVNMNRQHLTLEGNSLLSFNHTPVSFATGGPSGDGDYYTLDLDLTNPDLATLPTPNSGTVITTGVVLPWTTTAIVDRSYHGTISVTSQGNVGAFYGGPTPWAIPNGETANLTSTDSRPLVVEYGYNSFDTPLNPFVVHPGDGAPVGARARISGLKLLSEAPFVEGNNLRVACTFATSDTCLVDFARAETIEVRKDVGSPTSFVALTQTRGMNVTSGHFTQADVGKVLFFPTCCGDGAGQDYYGLIRSIVSATVITVQDLSSGYGFPTGITTGSATVGRDEPDAKYMVFLSCAGGIANETFSWGSLATTGFTITSDNATSTATCNALIVR